MTVTAGVVKDIVQKPVPGLPLRTVAGLEPQLPWRLCADTLAQALLKPPPPHTHTHCLNLSIVTETGSESQKN